MPLRQMFALFGRPHTDAPDLPLSQRQVATAAFALRCVPPMLLQPAVGFAIGRTLAASPALGDALAALGGKKVLVAPTDAAIGFLIGMTDGRPVIRCVDPASVAPAPDAHIAGRLAMLVGLLDGTVDGDAVFFTRGLSVRGDMSLVLILRNAIDRAALSPTAELRRLLGPLTDPTLLAADIAGSLLQLVPTSPLPKQPVPHHRARNEEQSPAWR